MVNPLKQISPASSPSALASAAVSAPDQPDAVQGRLHGYGPVAVIDIGSNSVRLVAYERLSRALTPLYNEKVLCGLGRGLAATGRLDTEAVDRTIVTLSRFRRLADQMQVKRLWVVATAAAREAENGSDFIAQAERVLGQKLDILSGNQEARAAAQGVQAGFHEPNGYVADLGGGSLELVRLDKMGVGAGVSHKLGAIRLQDESEGDLKQALKIARKSLEDSDLTRELKGKALYLVGGTWRNLAKLHISATGYPLSVMHGYKVPADDYAELCEDLIKGKFGDSDAMDAVSRNRRSLLPFGAAVFLALYEAGKPSSVTLSALGLREGLLYAALAPHEQARDPLLDAAYELALLRSRSPAHAQELAAWTGEVFAALGVEETGEEARLRKAASLLADIGWRAHTDYRGTQSHNIISHGAFAGIDHPGRLFLAMANYYRHEGTSGNDMDEHFSQITPKRLRERARMLGALFRVAYGLTASMAGVLPDIRIERRDKVLTLILPDGLEGLQGERIDKRLSSLARLFELEGAETVVSP